MIEKIKTLINNGVTTPFVHSYLQQEGVTSKKERSKIITKAIDELYSEVSEKEMKKLNIIRLEKIISSAIIDSKYNEALKAIIEMNNLTTETTTQTDDKVIIEI